MRNKPDTSLLKIEKKISKIHPIRIFLSVLKCSYENLWLPDANKLSANPSNHPSENKPMKRENGIPIQAPPQP